MKNQKYKTKDENGNMKKLITLIPGKDKSAEELAEEVKEQLRKKGYLKPKPNSDSQNSKIETKGQGRD